MEPIISNLDKYNLDYNTASYPRERVLFLKVEATGYTPKSSSLYLIGAAFYKDGSWKAAQWFSPDPSKESDILESFLEFSSGYDYLIHFNGNNFDLPFITEKCRQYGLSCSIDDIEGIDLYKRAVPLKRLLHLPNLKKKTLEKFFTSDSVKDMTEGSVEITADSPARDSEPTEGQSGSNTLSLYHRLLDDPHNGNYIKDILDSNLSYLAGLFDILPILAYWEIFTPKIEVTKVQARSYKDFNQDTYRELFMKLELPVPVPVEVSGFYNNCYFTAGGSVGALKVPIYDGELKYFYSNYKDYYYLPNEDTAVHKSIATYVDKADRVNARADTCYTRKTSSFLPQLSAVIMPIFKKEYRDRESYFEITPELKKDRDSFKKYAIHILSFMLGE